MTDRAEHAYDLLRIFPGITVSTLAIMMCVSEGSANSALMTCETRGLLVCEDDRGRLYQYEEAASFRRETEQ